MPTTSVDIPKMLYYYIESEVEDGKYSSKAEAIRDMIRKDMEQKHSVDEKLSREMQKRLESAREDSETVPNSELSK